MKQYEKTISRFYFLKYILKFQLKPMENGKYCEKLAKYFEINRLLGFILFYAKHIKAMNGNEKFLKLEKK